MSHKKYDVAVFIGRLQPYHLAHHQMVQQALTLADRVVLVMGSAFRARDPKNPFKWQERRDMVQVCFTPEDAQRIAFAPVKDYYEDEQWVAAVRGEVAKLAPGAKRIALLGHFKDASSYYLNRFPGWSLVEQSVSLEEGLSATQIRETLFSQEASWPVVKTRLSGMLPPPVLEYLSLWRKSDAFEQMCTEAAGNAKYHDMWKNVPYEVIFTTVDAVVRCNDSVLMVRRGRSPGKGLWALPGGFLEPAETLLQSALRELQEETSLGLLPSSMEHALQAVKVFDHPQRSLRGRTITHAHYFDLGRRNQMPEVHASKNDPGECQEVKWIELSKLAEMEEELFEDHGAILRAMPARRQP